MNSTENYKFRKPEGTDKVNVEDFNINMETIDKLIKKANDTIEELQLYKANLNSPTFTGIPKIKKTDNSEAEDIATTVDLSNALEVTNLDKNQNSGE